MPITLSPRTEARLKQKADREGRDINSVADDLISSILEWEAQDRRETIEGVRRGDTAAREGRERPLSTFIADQRIKYGFPEGWPFDESQQSV